jgi:hypothetical protein
MYSAFQVYVLQVVSAPKFCKHFSSSLILATCPTHRSFLDFNILTVLGDLYSQEIPP